MTQETRVFEVTEARARALERRIEAAGFRFRTIPHARWAGQGAGVVATCYRSGKLVVQGERSDVEGFVLQHLDGAEVPAGSADPPLDVPEGCSVIGADEAGKGDYFGPLVVAAVQATPERIEELRAGGAVRDSKKLSTSRLTVLAGALERHLPYRVRVCHPEEYNTLYERRPNLNDLLADLHAENLRALEREHPSDVVVVDQFSRASALEDRLRGRSFRLMQAPRGERHVVVAAASILARAHYLDALTVLSETYDLEFRPGSGPPALALGRRLVRAHGPDVLHRVAKRHFKVTDELLAGLEDGE